MTRPAVLCLEDELTTLAELGELIERSNYPVIKASSGSEAVGIAQIRKIGLLLADIKMPGLDGIDVACAIQEMQPDMPVAFFTAYSDDPQYRQRVRDAKLNVSAWIPKPVVGDKRRQLLSTVKHEMDLSLMRDMIERWIGRGWVLTEALAAAEAIAPTLDILEDTLRALKEQLVPPDSPEKVISDLLQALVKVRACFGIIEERQLAFYGLKEIALSRLGNVYEHFDQDTRRMALLIRMAVRQMSGLTLTSEQLDALEYALTKLANNEVEKSDRRDCRRRFRRAGIETMITLGPKTPELLDIYDEDEGEDELL
jgi:CheY-like chemotaxis protein